MNTMTIRKRKSIKDLPTGAKIGWLIALVMALTGLTMIVLDMAGVIEGSSVLEQGLCSVACLSSALLSCAYKDELYEEE